MATKKKGPAKETGLDALRHDTAAALNDDASVAEKVGKVIGDNPTVDFWKTAVNSATGGDKGSDPKAKKKTKKKKDEPTQAEIDAEEQKLIAANPWTQAGNALAGADEAGAQAAEQAMGAGPQSLTAAVSGQAQTQALADAGVSPGSDAGKWLSGEISQANANDSPLTAAMNAYSAAYEQTQPGVNNALANMGVANALSTSTAAENPYLNLLTGHFGNTNYETLTPTQVQGLPPALQYYLGPQGAQVQGVTGKSSSAIPSAGAILSGGTSPGLSPSALSPGTGTAPS